MNNLNCYCLFFIAFFGSCTNCFSQQAGSPVLKSGNREKIYIHYDRATYALGDTVWFKAYLFTGSQPSKSSKSFYLELFDNKGKLLKRVTAPIFQSSASGSMVLPEDTSVRGLHCRAYTAGMLQGDTSFIYTKALSVTSFKKATASPVVNAAHIRFLPEGGYWVNGIPALMAFTVTDINGWPVNAAGYIKAGDKIITSFSTAHDGMGAFTIIPEEGAAYVAVWKGADGTEYITPLPPARPQGIVMHIADVPNGRKFFVFRLKEAGDAQQSLFINAVINNTVIYHAKIDLTKENGLNGTIPVNGLPSGILYITVFDKDMKPLAERITFVNNHNYIINADVRLTLADKQKRGLNKISLSVSDTSIANISLAITDAGLGSQQVYEDNIVSHLLLTGDLRGKIVNPYYYFSTPGDSAAKYLDLVMLTHGWRKYNWDNTGSKKDAGPLAGDNFLSIDGKLSGFPNFNKLVSNAVSVIIQSADSSSVLLPLNIGKNGQFFRDGLIFYGNATLFFKFSDKHIPQDKMRISAVNGLIDSLHIPPFNLEQAGGSIFNIPALQPQPLPGYLAKKGVQQLKEVVIKAKIEKEESKLDRTYTSGMFSGGISTNLNVGNDPKALNDISVFQYLVGKVPGLKIADPLSLSPTASWRLQPVKFFLDNQEASGFDIRSLPMGEFDYIKIYDPSAGGAFRAYGGVVAFYTKKGKGFNYTNDNNLTIALAGYTPVKEFYSPDYATAVKNDASDLRPTLYWNPNISINKDHPEFNFRFYNNDVAGSFRVILEGVNAEGKLVHIEKVF
jgi:hypothetical protein